MLVLVCLFRHVLCLYVYTAILLHSQKVYFSLVKSFYTYIYKVECFLNFPPNDLSDPTLYIIERKGSLEPYSLQACNSCVPIKHSFSRNFLFSASNSSSSIRHISLSTTIYKVNLFHYWFIIFIKQ